MPRSTSDPGVFLKRSGRIVYGWTLKPLGDAARKTPSVLPTRGFSSALSRAVGISSHNFIWMDQIHGIMVQTIRRRPTSGFLPATDGVVTSTPDNVLLVRTADCVPILLYTPGGAAIAAVHAGWRGLLGNILPAAVESVCSEAHADASGVNAVIGPSIESKCYEIGEDVRQMFQDVHGGSFDEYFRKIKRRWHMSIAGIAKQQLRHAGLNTSRIEISSDCTACDATRFYSHRKRKEAGRTAAFIWITK